MKGDIPAAIAVEQLYPALFEQFVRSEQVLLARISSEGDDRRMFEEKQDIGNALVFAQLD